MSSLYIAQVVYGIFAFGIQFRYEKIDDRDEIWYEYGGRGDAAAEASHGKIQVNSGHGAYEAVGVHTVAHVDKSGEFPYG